MNTSSNTTASVDIGIGGMTCGHCEMAVKRALKQADPQAEITIDRTQNLVTVESAKAREDLSKAIAEEGYAVAA